MSEAGIRKSETRKGLIYRFLSWLVSILSPFALVLTAVRLLLTPAFVQIEYRTPNFPDDPYGFSLQDRLHWSLISLDFLLNDEEISYFDQFQLEDGSPLYNQRELSHMVDVKNVLKATLTVWYLALGGLLMLGLWAWRGDWWSGYRDSLARGGWITLILVGVVILFVLVGFGFFFVFFHQVLFPPGTWTFLYSDTFIRLFPERFWRDTFLAVGLISLIGGLALAFGFRRRLSS